MVVLVCCTNIMPKLNIPPGALESVFTMISLKKPNEVKSRIYLMHKENLGSSVNSHSDYGPHSCVHTCRNNV